MSKLKVYGIKNCNTVKSALDWLKNNKTDFEFHDYKTQSITEQSSKHGVNKSGGRVLSINVA
jgi:arsenate reductase